MSDLITDLILRIGQADGDTLRDIYVKEIQRPIFTEDEREILLNAFGNRAATLNAQALGLGTRWRTTNQRAQQETA